MTICSAIQHLKHPKCNVDLSMHHAHSAPLFLFAVCCYFKTLPEGQQHLFSSLLQMKPEFVVCCLMELLAVSQTTDTVLLILLSGHPLLSLMLDPVVYELDFIPQKSNTNRFLEELVCFGPLLKSQFDSKLESLKRLTSAGVCLEIYGP